jgi:hypothetical protein
MSTCCPTESKHIPQVNFSPERRSQKREEPGERLAPAAHHAQKTHQDVEQQRGPDLPTDRVCAVAQKSPPWTTRHRFEWRLHFRLGLFKVMFLRDKDWAQVVKTNRFPPITILTLGD